MKDSTFIPVIPDPRNFYIDGYFLNAAYEQALKSWERVVIEYLKGREH